MHRAKWTQEEDASLRELYPLATWAELQARFGRSKEGIGSHARSLGLRRQTERAMKLGAGWQPRAKPLGSERMEKGVLIRKVAVTPDPRRGWKPVEKIEWEAVNGALPPR